MRHYEIMFIVRPNLSEDEITKVAKQFEDVITKNGSKVTNVIEMGQKELAYEINDFKNGYYYVINLDAEDDKAINEFDRLARNSKDVIRTLITKVED